MPPTAHSKELPTQAARTRLAVSAILDMLDAVDDSRFRNRRATGRFKLRRFDVPVRITHPGGSVSERCVVTRNLSASGVGFLYDRFLHLGTNVVIRLPRQLGGEDALVGKVIYCAHVSGAYHQIGVRFDQKIFAKLYVDSTPPEGAGNAAKSASSSANLIGHMLLIDGDPMDRALVAHHLRETQLKIVAIEKMAGVADAIKAAGSAFDAVLVEANPNTDGAIDIVRSIRAAGFGGAIIVAAAARRDAALRAKATKIGAAAVVAKPYERGELLDALGQVLAATRSPSAETVMLQSVEKSVEQVKQLNAIVDSVNSPKKA